MAQQIKQRIALEGAEEVRRQLAAIGKEGEAAFKKLEQATQSTSTSRLASSINKLQNEITAAASSTNAVSVGLAGIAANSGTASGSVSGLAATFATLRTIAATAGIAVAGIGAAALLAGRQFLELGRETAKTFNDISKNAQNVGVSAQEFQKLARGAAIAGVESDTLAKALEKIDRDIGKGLIAASDAAKQAGSNIRTLSTEAKTLEPILQNVGTGIRSIYAGTAGVAISITRFGVEAKKAAVETTDLRKQIEGLGVSYTRADGSVKSTIQIFLELAAALQKLPDDARRRAIIDNLGLQGLDQLVKVSAANIQAEITRIEAAYGRLSPAAQAAASANEEAARRFNSSWREASAAIGRPFIELDTALKNFGASFLDTFVTIISRFQNGQWLDAAKASLELFGNQLYFVFISPFERAFSDINTAFGNLLSSLLNQALQIASNIASAISSAFSSAPPTGSTMDGFLPPEPFARGGYIRGRGTSTSDSILARLSNGEFVMRAAAVRKFGPQFFAALNSLRLPQFATGGLVDAMAMPSLNLSPSFELPGSGPALRPLAVTIGGETFNMMAPEDTAQSLMRFATVKQIRSNGRKPSWHGG